MDPFNPKSKCIKCGHDESEVNYQKQLTEADKRPMVRSHNWQKNPTSLYATGDEVLRHTCSRCGYHWNEAPLDQSPSLETNQNLGASDEIDYKDYPTVKDVVKGFEEFGRLLQNSPLSTEEEKEMKFEFVMVHHYNLDTPLLV